MNGTVKKFDNDRGFGFINTENGDLFFHISAVEFGLKIAAGDSVAFDVVPDAKSGRNKAVNVKLAEAA